MEQIDLSKFLTATKADGVIIMNQEGNVIDYLSFLDEKNAAAMLAVINHMITDFAKERNLGELKQVIIKAEKGLFILGKQEDIIIGVFTKEISKSGIIMASMNKLIKSKIA